MECSTTGPAHEQNSPQTQTLASYSLERRAVRVSNSTASPKVQQSHNSRGFRVRGAQRASANPPPSISISLRRRKLDGASRSPTVDSIHEMGRISSSDAPERRETVDSDRALARKVSRRFPSIRSQ